jgi:hypothetical protein
MTCRFNVYDAYECDPRNRLTGSCFESDAWGGVYAGSTSLSFQVFGRHLGGAGSLERCDSARLRVSCFDS